MDNIDHLVDILHKLADDADTGNVFNVCLEIFDVKAVFIDFFKNA